MDEDQHTEAKPDDPQITDNNDSLHKDLDNAMSLNHLSDANHSLSEDVLGIIAAKEKINN